MGGQRYAPSTLTPGDPVPILQEVGWAPEGLGQVRKISLPPGIDHRTVKPVASPYNYCAIPTLVPIRATVKRN